MSYTPTTWQTGDELTIALMNKMEHGVNTKDLFIIEQTTELDNNRVIYTLITPVEDIMSVINDNLIIGYIITKNLDNNRIYIQQVKNLIENENYIVINGQVYNKNTGIGIETGNR